MDFNVLGPSSKTAAVSGARTVQDIEREAGQMARQNFGAVVPGIYVEGSAVRLTKEQAFARALEANPETYERFRSQHNAAPIVAALKAAGVAIRGL